MDKRTCGRCKRELELTEFYKNSRSKSGYQGYCKRCTKEYKQEYNAIHSEKVTEQQRAWRAAHPGYHSEYYRNVIVKGLRKKVAA